MKVSSHKSNFNNVCALMFTLSLLLGGCASYKLGSVGRTIPGGYKQISIPVFKNRSQEPGVEVAFTNALIQNFHRSKVANIVSESLSDVIIEGSVDAVSSVPSARKSAGDASAPFMPTGTVIATEYNVVATVTVQLVRVADGFVLWKDTFASDKTYAAPQVTLAGVNSVNPLYNLSARRQNIDTIASDLMIQVHDRITENF